MLFYCRHSRRDRTLQVIARHRSLFHLSPPFHRFTAACPPRNTTTSSLLAFLAPSPSLLLLLSRFRASFRRSPQNGNSRAANIYGRLAERGFISSSPTVAYASSRSTLGTETPLHTASERRCLFASLFVLVLETGCGSIRRRHRRVAYYLGSCFRL